MTRSSASAIVCFAAVLAACSQTAPRGGANEGGSKELSDDALAAYSAKVMQLSYRERVSDQHQEVGLHHGAKVIADFLCSDLCPNNTVAIVHYDVPPGEACRRVGGVTRLEWVPVSITIAQRHYCVPKVLADRHIQTDPFK